MSEPTREELLAQITALQRQLTARQSSSGGTAQDSGVAAGAEGVAVGGDINSSPIITGNENVVYNFEAGTTVVIGELPVTMTAVDRESALGRYLHHVISRNRYLQLQGIRSGGSLDSSLQLLDPEGRIGV